MSESRNTQFPFKSLGAQLKKLRERKNESLAEVSGAVEINIDELSAFEQGEQRPSEDILMLLISHFNAKEETATKLWELAGYTKETIQQESGETIHQMQPAMMVLPIDARIIYSDTVHVMVNNYGVVMQFMQNAGPNGQQVAIARVGMSKEHARSVLDVLQKTLSQAEQKKLPPTDSSPQDKQG